MPRLEARIERLRTTYRFTWAFHAREVRFERDSGQGPERVFAETFSFHAARHDPAELYLQLEDLWSSPRLLGPNANLRDAHDLVLRLLAALPGYLSAILDRLEHADPAVLARACEDLAVFTQILSRFLVEKGLEEDPRLELPGFHLRKLSLRVLVGVMRARVRPEFLARWMAGDGGPSGPPPAPGEVAFFYALARGDQDEIDRSVTASAEAAFHRWLEDVCLDTSRSAFESEGSPFAERSAEVLAAVAERESGPVERGRDLSPFLRRAGNRDCARVLQKLETFFLRDYDVYHAAVVLNHAANLASGRDDAEQRLSWHARRNYLLALLIPALPFGIGVVAYERIGPILDWIVAAEILLALALSFWFLGYRFMWKRDLTFFRAAVPRIGAGIIVGYLPVFLIDEVWDLAEQSLLPLATTVMLLGSVTLLYIYVEVQRNLRDPDRAFERALDLFLIGVLEAAALGFVVTSLLGPLMAARNWGGAEGAATLTELQQGLAPFLGQLPRIVGVEPLNAFPSAILLMTVMSFFIGTFLQLLWEDLPITEPL
jgi:hypothetical protein